MNNINYYDKYQKYKKLYLNYKGGSETPSYLENPSSVTSNSIYIEVIVYIVSFHHWPIHIELGNLPLNTTLDTIKIKTLDFLKKKGENFIKENGGINFTPAGKKLFELNKNELDVTNIFDNSLYEEPQSGEEEESYEEPQSGEEEELYESPSSIENSNREDEESYEDSQSGEEEELYESPSSIENSNREDYSDRDNNLINESSEEVEESGVNRQNYSDNDTLCQTLISVLDIQDMVIEITIQ